MFRFVFFVLALMSAAGAWASPQVIKDNSNVLSTTYLVTFRISDTADSDAMPVSGSCSVRFKVAGSDAISLYAVQSASDSAATGTLIRAFSASTTTTAYTFEPGTRFVKAKATTAATGGSELVIQCSPLVGGGGGDPDPDNDGLYDFAVLWDADGDGSVWVDCTAKDTPDSACKAAGERIYVDTADDLNCAIWGCNFGQMEIAGTIYLEQGVYINWPCYDYSVAAANVANTYNKRGEVDDDDHDQTTDPAYSHCPASPDPDTTRRMYAINFMDWQGEVIGAGVDTRNPATTSGYKRDQGTYLVDDRGPSYASGVTRVNTWFGQTGFVRGITFGFQAGGVASTSAPVNAGEYAADGDSKGYGVVSGTQTLATYQTNQGLCVVDSSGLSTLVAGDVIEVKSTSGTSGSLASSSVATALRVRDTPASSNCDAGHGGNELLIPIGGRVAVNGTLDAYFSVTPPFMTQFTDQMTVAAVRSDYFDSTARIANLNIEPQDAWDESTSLGGDCAEVSTATGDGYTAALDEDATNADMDCDTNPLFGFFGAGHPVLEDVVIRKWHEYALDGDSNAGNPLMRRIRFFNGRGGPIADMGTGWKLHDVEVHDTQFASTGISTYGPGLEIRDSRLYNTFGQSYIKFTELSVGNLVENTRVENSGLNSVFYFVCGARRNIVRNTFYENSHGIGLTILSRNGIIAYFECADTANPIEQNVIDGFTATGVQYGQQLSGAANVTAAIGFDTNATIATPGSAAISRNTFMNGVMKSTKSAHGACLFAAIDDDTVAAPNDRTGLTPDDFSHEDVLALNTFMSNSVHASGGGGAAEFVYCGCSINLAGAGNTGTDYFDQCSVTVGSGSGIGANARGCLNMDNNAAPAAGETCS